jgi:hypothetical protein
MLAGGMVIAAPSMVPEAAAAGSLYVSAENALFVLVRRATETQTEEE